MNFLGKGEVHKAATIVAAFVFIDTKTSDYQLETARQDAAVSLILTR
jgi:hypothetical protein